jgi:hypothetical protein
LAGAMVARARMAEATAEAEAKAEVMAKVGRRRWWLQLYNHRQGSSEDGTRYKMLK